VTALDADREQPGVDEAHDVTARGRRGNARLGGEHARRQRAAVAQRQQHPRTGAVGEDRAQRGEVGIAHMPVRLDA
jgi:hypothetical protein